MARKFGKKNVITLDIMGRYNLGLIGQSGVGKTTLAKEVCEKLVGEDGYLILQLGREDGADGISGIMYESVPDWDTFEEIVDDIIENKATDYKDLKVIGYDTLDELIRLAEEETLRQWNRKQDSEKKPKYAETINGCFGGFGRGEKHAIEIIQEKMWELKQVGVSMFLIGHTKTKTLTDPVTDQEYDMLTTNMQNNYFNAFVTKLHVLGVASINREIDKVETGKVNIVTKQKEFKGKVSDARRIITFRDDNFAIDSKSRFANIVPQIPLDSDEFIKAIKDAILAEASKDGLSKPVEEVEKEQAQQEEERVAKELKKKQIEKDEEKLQSMVDDIDRYYKKFHKTKPINLKELLLLQKELDIKYTDIQESDMKLSEKLEVAEKLLATIG